MALCGYDFGPETCGGTAALVTLARTTYGNTSDVSLLTQRRNTLISQRLSRGVLEPQVRVDTLTLTAAALLQEIQVFERDLGREEQEELLRRRLERCLATREVLRVANYAGDIHPCKYVAVFFPSEFDAGDAAVVVHNDIYQRRLADMVLTFRSDADSVPVVVRDMRSRGLSSTELTARSWYNAFPACNPAARQQYRDDVGEGGECQEYPYFASTKAGPGGGIERRNPRASILMVDGFGNSRVEGARYGSFVTRCPTVVAKQPFLVLPQLEETAPGLPTGYYCSRS